jgi:hypothetical protein
MAIKSITVLASEAFQVEEDAMQEHYHEHTHDYHEGPML